MAEQEAKVREQSELKIRQEEKGKQERDSIANQINGQEAEIKIKFRLKKMLKQIVLLILAINPKKIWGIFVHKYTLRNLFWCCLILLLSTTATAQESFFDQRYRGWLWFEEKAGLTGNKNQDKQVSDNDITGHDAKAEIEEFAKQLEELKFIMLARPTVENIKSYRDKEKQMWDKAILLHENWDMANLLYPQQRDLINNPVNVHAVKAKRQIDRVNNQKQIKEFAGKFDLVLFFDQACKYCQLFSPVLKSFAEDYDFNIEAINKAGAKHQYFKTTNNQQLIEQLGISNFPTVIAIAKDGSNAFELIRGYVTISELEEYSLLAIKHLAMQGKYGVGEND